MNTFPNIYNFNAYYKSNKIKVMLYNCNQSLQLFINLIDIFFYNKENNPKRHFISKFRNTFCVRL